MLANVNLSVALLCNSTGFQCEYFDTSHFNSNTCIH